LYTTLQNGFLMAGSNGLVVNFTKMSKEWNEQALAHFQTMESSEKCTIFPKTPAFLEDYSKKMDTQQRYAIHEQEYIMNQPSYAAHKQHMQQPTQCPMPTPQAAHNNPYTPMTFISPLNSGATPQGTAHQPRTVAVKSQPVKKASNPNRQQAQAGIKRYCKTCKRHKTNATGHYKGKCYADQLEDAWPDEIRPSRQA
jgi:hypothetical protein